ncbi:MAG: class I SAM-dependent methyltransferase [Oligoflexia bacterium]|nr:class I SAM-dependent methyltransferase [Oligoflexia bacterium]
MTAVFDFREPFPLLPTGSYRYAEAQEHARHADAWLGLRTESIERGLLSRDPPAPGQRLWIGTPPRTFLTPYLELREIMETLALVPGATIVDLGAGYARLAFVVARHYPHTRYLGYELVAERVAEARAALERQGFRNAELLRADLSDPSFSPKAAEAYFIYDYGTRNAIAKTLEDLRLIAQATQKTLGRGIAVVGRGRASRDAIEREHPWLSQVVPPRHFPHYSIYKSSS